MHFTTDQQEQLREAKLRGERHATMLFTPEQRKAWRDTVDKELAGKHDNLEHFRKIKQAAEQAGFLGDIRRAIVLSRRPIDELAVAIGVEPRTLSDFRTGEAELPAVALDRLIETLGLRLMQEIPR